LDLIPAPAWIHADGIILHANPAMARLLGLAGVVELIGKPAVSIVDSASRDAFVARTRDVLACGDAQRAEMRLVTSSAESAEVEVAAVRILRNGVPAVLAIFTDVTIRKKAERSLRELTERYQTTLRCTPGIVFTARPDGFNFDCSAGAPPVLIDPAHVELIVKELIENAVEAIGDHDHGEVAISVRSERLNTRADDCLAPGDYVLVTVRDNGPGMTGDTLAKIFDPFFSTKFTGRGLGLAAINGIMRACGGAVRVCSALGRGSTFRVYFPCARDGAADRRDGTA
jgi:PAS domain S-box-containing protein